LEAQPQVERFKFDIALVSSAISDGNAWRSLVERHGGQVWSLCERLCSESDCDAAFDEIWQSLRDNNCGALRAYDGRASFGSYLHFLTANVLAGRFATAFTSEPERAWSAFEQAFRREIERMIHQVLGSSEALTRLGSSPEDLYQEVVLGLVADNFRRLRAYDGRGSFSAFVRTLVRNICLDWQRQQQGRRRLPVAIQRLGELDQQIYRWLCWSGHSEREVLLQGSALASEEMVSAAIERVRKAAGGGRSAPRQGFEELAADDNLGSSHGASHSVASPEGELLEHEQEKRRELLLEKLRDLLRALPSPHQLYVRLRFFDDPPLAPWRIADVMRLGEKEIYKIRQEVQQTLRRKLAEAGYRAESLSQLLD